MKSFCSPRVVRCLACAASLLGLLSACGGDDAGAPLAPTGPVSIEISSITLAEGPVRELVPAALGCDYRIGVVLELGTGWNLQAPGVCATTQCGQVRVSLVGPDGTEISSRVAASLGVDLNVASLMAEAGSADSAQTYSVHAELVDDSGKAFAVGGATVTANQAFQMILPSDCSEPSGNGGSGGSGGDSDSDSGSSGDSGSGG